MTISRNNFTGLQVSELEGVDVTYLTVDYTVSMAAEIGDPLADSDLAGLTLVQQAIMNQGINILGMGPLGNSSTEQTFMVRTDSLDTANHITANGLRDAIRAVDAERAASRSPSATANLATATVTVKTLTIAV
jgi:hypothetical protein|tara:strand:+ start:105 stop:503 length:399 start_codon:yes stop_codon:yes gene_type:complete